MNPAAVQAQRTAIEEAVAAIRARVDAAPDVALILGTGLGGLADAIDVHVAIPYAHLPHFPESTVESHAGRLLIGSVAGRSVVALQGRFHRYEGYSLQTVTFPVRVMHALGAEVLAITNACGGLNPLWAAGELMVIDDHINLLGDNPLIGPNLDDLGPRFPDMSAAYDPELKRAAEAAALALGVPLRRGVYAAVTGPNLETRAEYRMLRTIGADVVGMSTVPEVIVARHMDMRVLGLSVITDMCLPDALAPTGIDEIVRTARAAEPALVNLMTRVLRDLGDEASQPE